MSFACMWWQKMVIAHYFHVKTSQLQCTTMMIYNNLGPQSNPKKIINQLLKHLNIEWCCEWVILPTFNELTILASVSRAAFTVVPFRLTGANSSILAQTIWALIHEFFTLSASVPSVTAVTGVISLQVCTNTSVLARVVSLAFIYVQLALVTSPSLVTLTPERL